MLVLCWAGAEVPEGPLKLTEYATSYPLPTDSLFPSAFADLLAVIISIECKRFANDIYCDSLIERAPRSEANGQSYSSRSVFH